MAAHMGFAALLDQLAGRPVRGHADPADVERARRLLDAGRRALAAPAPSTRLMRRALKILADARREPRRSILRLVLDSLTQAAPALRAGAVGERRFLRFEGDVVVDLQITEQGRGVEVRGQIQPPDAAAEAIFETSGKRRSAKVESDGTFVLRGVAPGACEVTLGNVRIVDLVL